MSQPESVDYSYIRAVRDVEPSTSLDDFYSRARPIAKKVFGLRGDVQVVSLPATLKEVLEPDYQREYEGSGVLMANIFAVSSLRVTLFERRALANDEVNELIPKVLARVTAPYVSGSRSRKATSGKKSPGRRRNPLPEDLRNIETAHGFDHGEFSLEADALVDSTKPSYATRGVEYALAVRVGSAAAKVLGQQAETIDVAVRKIVAAKPLFGGAFEDGGNVLHIPFMQAPKAAPEAHELFVDAMNESFMQEGPVTVSLSGVKWRSNTAY